MVVVYPKYFIMPVVIDTEMKFNTDENFRTNASFSDDKVINGKIDEFYEADNEFINSEI